MRAGELDRRVTLQRLARRRDAMNAQVSTWEDLATVWASYAPLRDAERLQAAERGATIDARFQIRWSSAVASLSAKDQLLFEGRTFAIVGVKEVGGRRQGLEISAVARADLT